LLKLFRAEFSSRPGRELEGLSLGPEYVERMGSVCSLSQSFLGMALRPSADPPRLIPPLRWAAMAYAVVLRSDQTGACPVILRDDSKPLPGGDGVRYRFVLETGDEDEAVRVADRLWHQCRSAELPPP
jgi:hypothetical protein